MISLFLACESQVEHDAKSAAVCSSPPSEVGTGIDDFDVMDVESGRK